MKIGGRGGYEYFPKDKNFSYTIAQWFPRMAVYDDKEGWQNKQFLGRGEFALPFGDYELNITVPADFIVAATGDLQNAKEVLTKCPGLFAITFPLILVPNKAKSPTTSSNLCLAASFG